MNESKAVTETIRLMQNHVTVRRYTDEKIPREHLLEILRAAQGASTSHFVQAYSIIHITDEAKKQKMAELSRNPQVATCSDFLLFCGDYKRLEYACRMHGVEMDYDHMDNLIVAITDPALVAENALTAAESLGYGGCFIGGVRNNPEAISELAGLPDKVFPVFGLTLGVPAVINEVKPRLPLEAIVHENVYDEKKYPALLEQYDETMRAYYKKRTANKKDTTWTKDMSEFLQVRRRDFMRDFMASRGFRLS